MELIDVYNVHGQKTGRIVDKDTPLNQDEYRMAVGIWVSDDNGNLLVTRRSMEKRFAPGKWENSAGHVQAGETPEDGIIRELREETGVEVSLEQIVYLGKAAVSWPYLGMNYGVRLKSRPSEVKLQPGETDAYRWVSHEEFEAMRDRGDFATSVFEYMKGYYDAFLTFMGWEKE